MPGTLSMAVEAVSVPESRPLRRSGARRKGAARRADFSFRLWICWALVLCAAAASRPHAPIIYAAGWDKPGPVLSEFSAKNRRMEAHPAIMCCFSVFFFGPKASCDAVSLLPQAPAANASQSQGGVLLYRTCPFKGWWKEDKINWRTLLQFSAFLP